jgi:hypothetical protein
MSISLEDGVVGEVSVTAQLYRRLQQPQHDDQHG